jgi:hypothetical protein
MPIGRNSYSSLLVNDIISVSFLANPAQALIQEGMEIYFQDLLLTRVRLVGLLETCILQ